MMIFALLGGRRRLRTLPGWRARHPQHLRAHSRHVRAFAARIGGGPRRRSERTLKTVKHIVAYASAGLPMQHAAAADPRLSAELEILLPTPTFYVLVVTQMLSIIGSRMTGMAIGIRVFADTGASAPVLPPR